MEQKFKWYALKLLVIIVFIYIIQITVQGFTDNFVLVSADVLSRPWILITSIFLHGSFQHLFYNMFSLAIFGLILEKTVGGKRFFIAFFVSGIFASIAASLLYEASLGASGAIFGLMGYLATLRPKMVIWAYGVPMPMVAAVFLWVGVNFAGLFFPGDIAYAAHLGGLFFGIVIGVFDRKSFSEKKDKTRGPLADEEIERWEDKYMG